MKKLIVIFLAALFVSCGNIPYTGPQAEYFDAKISKTEWKAAAINGTEPIIKISYDNIALGYHVIGYPENAVYIYESHNIKYYGYGGNLKLLKNGNIYNLQNSETGNFDIVIELIDNNNLLFTQNGITSAYAKL